MNPDIHYHQRRFWVQLTELRAHLDYVYLHHARAHERNNSINIFMALASSGSIAGWAIWQDLQVMWAVIIASSQVLIAIGPHLPFQKRIKNLAPLSAELHNLLLWGERQWYEIAEGRLTNDAINGAIFELKERKATLDTTYLMEDPLPFNKDLVARGIQRARQYLQTSYK